MPAPPYVDTVGQIVRLTSACLYPDSFGGQQVEEINMSYVCSVAGGGDSRLALATAFNAPLLANVPSTLRTDNFYYGVKLSTHNLTPPPSPVTIISNTAGTSTADQLPTQARGLLTFATAVGGRSGRGRIYTFTPTVTYQGPAGSPLTSYKTVWNTIVGALFTFSVGGSTWILCLAHRSKTKPYTFTQDPILGHNMDLKWATQRRSGETGKVNAAPW